MTILQSIFLGVVQGLGEFLPVSSSGHLVVIRWLFNIPNPGVEALAFDAALHLGTAVAVLAFFWPDFVKLGRALLKSVATRKASTPDEKMAWYLVIGSIPGGVVGVALERVAGESLRAPLLVATTLAVMGVVLYAADRYSKKTKNISHVGLKDAMVVGAMQAVAIIPGVSRSGITMSTSLFRNFDRRDAARFSFLLSAPVTFGAGAYEIRWLLRTTPNLTLFVGVATSAIVGYLSIKYLLEYLAKGSFSIFALYRLALAALIVGVFLIRGA